MRSGFVIIKHLIEFGQPKKKVSIQQIGEKIEL